MRFRERLYLFIFGLILNLIFGCKDQTSSLFSSQLANDRGSISVTNFTNYLGSTVPGTSFEETLVVYASGGIPVSNLSASISSLGPISFSGGAYPGEGGTCGTELASGDTCTLVLLYEPTSTTTHYATIDFSYSDELGPGAYSYQVYADSFPMLRFEYGTQYDFGNKFIGTTTDLRILVTNMGRVPATTISINNLTLPYSFKGGAYPGVGGNCGTQLEPGSTCTLVISYAPTANGQHLQDITFDYFNSGRPESSTLNLLAWGFLPAELTASSSGGIDFGTVAAGHSYSSAITLTHSGGDVAATNIAVTGLSSPYTMSGGTCGSTLSKAAGSCNLNFVLNTALSGTWNQTITISYNTGREVKTITRTISAVTQQKGLLSFSPTGALDFGAVALGQTSDRTITVTYASGEMSVTNFGINSTTTPFGYAGGSFPGTGGTCGTTITSGSCTVVLTFSPSSRNTFTSSRWFSYHDGYSVNQASYTFSGITDGQLSWYILTNLNFGDVVVGQSKTITATLSASAGTAVTSLAANNPTAPFTFVGGAYPGGGTCGTSLSNSNCTVRFTFSPTASGAQSQGISVTYFDGIQNRTLTGTLSGNGTAAAILSVADRDFGATGVNSNVVRYVTITNGSAMAATNINLSVAAPFSLRTAGQTCTVNGTLAAGASCTFGVVFTPTAATAYSGTATLSYNDGTGTKTATGTLTGIGEANSELYLSEYDTYSFGNRYIGSSLTRSFTLRQGGSATPVSITSKTLSLSSDYTISSDTCPASLANGATCTISVAFSPSTTGLRSNSLTVNYDNGTAGSVTRLMSGTGLTPAVISFTPSSYDFGTLSTDQTYDYTLTITHTGAAATGTPSFTGSGFSYAGSGAFPGGGTCNSNFYNGCTVGIRFTPTSAVSYSGTFRIVYNNGYASTTASIALAGAGTPTSVLTYATSSTNFGTLIQSLTTTRTVTVNHSGAVAATSMSATLSSPFRFAGGSYPGTGGTCGSSLSSGSCTIVVEYAPTTTGTHSSSLVLTYNNGSASRSISHTLNGEAVAQAILSKSETGSYNFGSQAAGTSKDKTITITNAGGTQATSIVVSFSSVRFAFKGDAFPGTGGTCGTTLAAGADCTIVIQFRPAAATAYTGTMTTNYNDGLRTQTDLLDLSGQGI